MIIPTGLLVVSQGLNWPYIIGRYEDPTIGESDPGQGFETYINLPDRKGTWIAEVDGKTKGSSGLLTCIYDEAEIEPITVSSDYRRQGTSC